MEAHCVNLELKYQNQVLKEGQQGQFLNVKSNEAKVKHDIDVIETINIELEHKVAKLLKENETLKRHYKEMFDSIKTTRAKNIEHTTSLIANNDKFKAQLQEKGFAIAALKNELRKLTGNSFYLRLFAAERKCGVCIFGGQFVARLAEHFRLLTAEILGGLMVIALELPIIDMAELVRLQIYAQFDDKILSRT
ncbi:hypothetical protein Tco_1017114 [Tanacetum coccineum]|uniref:Uncharacterized protein n=1 Tax=Tanacetum coccineum TaxID=301880 RepID=A0ABQ5FR34_9ASTR